MQDFSHAHSCSIHLMHCLHREALTLHVLVFFYSLHFLHNFYSSNKGVAGHLQYWIVLFFYFLYRFCLSFRGSGKRTAWEDAVEGCKKSDSPGHGLARRVANAAGGLKARRLVLYPKCSWLKLPGLAGREDARLRTEGSGIQYIDFMCTCWTLRNLCVHYKVLLNLLCT